MAAFVSVPRVLTGWGCAESTGKEAARLGHKVLLVTGRSAMRSAGITERIIALIRAAGSQVAAFEEVEAEPEAETVDRGRRHAREQGCGVVVCLGGGSVLDAGKAIAALAHEDMPALEYVRGRRITSPGLSIVAMPTTSGTGSEVTPNSVLTLRGEQTKKSIRADTLLLAAAIVDPELTVPLPRELTAASGLDALTQAVESYWSVNATPLTESLSLRAVGLLAGSLETACNNGANRSAREACSYGSLMAGMALANARLGVVHGIAHPVGARYHVPHGLACAILLPQALRLNRPAEPEKYARLCEAVGCDLIEFVDGLLEHLGIPRTFESFGLAEDDFDTIVEQSLPSGSLKANPKLVDAQDVRNILRAVVK